MTAALEAELWLLGADVPAGGPSPRTQRALRLASELGAPVRDVLLRERERADAEAEARRVLRRATAQGRAAALGLVLVPPVLAPLVGTLAGVSSRPRAWVLLVAGALWAAGGAVTLLLVRRATAPRGASPWTPLVGGALALGLVVTGRLGPALLVVAGGLAAARRARRRPTVDPGLDELLDLTALALHAGRGIGAALRAAGPSVPALADTAQRLALWLELGGVGGPPVLPDLGRDLLRAHRAGLPQVPVVAAHAARLRAEELHARLERAERLPVQLAVPLALLLLPAALLLVLAPLAELALGALR